MIDAVLAPGTVEAPLWTLALALGLLATRAPACSSRAATRAGCPASSGWTR
jgi:hypothetical protein